MKEILFRGKRTDRDKWVQGYYVFNTNGFDFDDDEYKEYHRIQPLQPNGMLDIIREVDPATVGQYTGLTDKNGNKIFEGDIVICKQDRTKDVCTIGFENAAFMAYPANGEIYELTLWQYWYSDWDIENIGNIHDNPELLKGGVIDE